MIHDETQQNGVSTSRRKFMKPSAAAGAERLRQRRLKETLPARWKPSAARLEHPLGIQPFHREYA